MALSAKISALAGKLAGLRGRYGDFGILAFANFRCDAQFGNRQAVGHIGAAKDQSYRLPAFQRDLRRAIGETAGDNVDFPLPVGANRAYGGQKPGDCGEYGFHHRWLSPNDLFYGARYFRISFSSSAQPRAPRAGKWPRERCGIARSWCGIVSHPLKRSMGRAWSALSGSARREKKPARREKPPTLCAAGSLG